MDVISSNRKHSSGIFGFESNPLTEDQLDILRTILIEQKSNLLFKHNAHACFDLEQEERSDDVDHANADISNFQRIHFLARESQYQKKVDEALRRIDEGDYGLCCDCGSSITFLRLRARPTAELCIQCKEEAEREEVFGHYYRSSASSSSSTYYDAMTH